MKVLTTLLAGAALALTGTAASAETLVERNEAKLARMLEGRTAGEPVSCITTPRTNKLEVIEKVGVVYDAGDTIYVARPSHPNQLGRSDVVVIQRFGSQLCKTDVTRTIDRMSGHVSGAVFLSDFVPYTKNG